MSEHISENTVHHEPEWSACPAGEFRAMLKRMKGRQQKIFAAQLIGGAAFGMLLGLAFVTLTTPKDNNFGGITCADVQENADAYFTGRLDAELTKRIDAHLAECPHCGPLFRRMREERKTERAVTTFEQDRASSPYLTFPRSFFRFRRIQLATTWIESLSIC